eukprot:1445758-Amphidinium_carterae.1
MKAQHPGGQHALMQILGGANGNRGGSSAHIPHCNVSSRPYLEPKIVPRPPPQKFPRTKR